LKDDSERSEGRPNRVNPFRLQNEAERAAVEQQVGNQVFRFPSTAISSAFSG
jgi:hypothetical protein